VLFLGQCKELILSPRMNTSCTEQFIRTVSKSSTCQIILRIFRYSRKRRVKHAGVARFNGQRQNSEV
jgi:hypothetical protein